MHSQENKQQRRFSGVSGRNCQGHRSSSLVAGWLTYCPPPPFPPSLMFPWSQCPWQSQKSFVILRWQYSVKPLSTVARWGSSLLEARPLQWASSWVGSGCHLFFPHHTFFVQFTTWDVAKGESFWHLLMHVSGCVSNCMSLILEE